MLRGSSCSGSRVGCVRRLLLLRLLLLLLLLLPRLGGGRLWG